MHQFLENVTGYNTHLILSMSIFIAFFVGLLIYVLTVDKKHIEKMKNMPFDKNENQN
ncbi:MAG: cbb3-type cytochrome c oxidase subunit 3 [Bacteroidota bacterium]|jgi:hypothetical protein